MAAGVHDAGHLRPELTAFGLLDGKSVHVSPEENGPSRLSAVQKELEAQFVFLIDIFRLHSVGLEKCLDRPGGAVLVVSQLRMHVKIPP